MECRFYTFLRIINFQNDIMKGTRCLLNMEYILVSHPMLSCLFFLDKEYGLNLCAQLSRLLETLFIHASTSQWDDEDDDDNDDDAKDGFEFIYLVRGVKKPFN